MPNQFDPTSLNIYITSLCMGSHQSGSTLSILRIQLESQCSHLIINHNRYLRYIYGDIRSPNVSCNTEHQSVASTLACYHQNVLSSLLWLRTYDHHSINAIWMDYYGVFHSFSTYRVDIFLYFAFGFVYISMIDV
eukprot:304224_1